MPQEAYIYNVFIPTGVSAQAQPPTRSPGESTTLLEAVGEETPWPTASAAQTSINTGVAVVLCLGNSERTPLIWATPVYTNISAVEHHNSGSDERFDFAALFAVVDAQPDPIETRR
ncbi:hypothetical protein [Salinigranum halophilum]|uniref:hypothetical protein n=1 Tax=Salinigranum halophilum TaxID=2565931 RepID=UPI0010A84591|nr:hypothetical protein [Salinigranum halophilum]